jgi:hypothetical protein
MRPPLGSKVQCLGALPNDPSSKDTTTDMTSLLIPLAFQRHRCFDSTVSVLKQAVISECDLSLTDFSCFLLVGTGSKDCMTSPGRQQPAPQSGFMILTNH